jgi:hypothetical protein
LPPGYCWLAEPRSPDQVACLLEQLADADVAERLRERFLKHFSEESHLKHLADALLSVERAS